MTNIGMLTPDRFHMERSHSLFDFPRRLFLNPLEIDDDDDNNNNNNRDSPFTNRFGPCGEPVSSAKKKPKAWSVRARRDIPNLLRGDRFIPRRIDLDCDYALDSLVSQNLQISSRVVSSTNGQTVSIEQQQLIRQQRRAQKRSNQQTQTTSSRKTLELLEHFMPQNRRIYNFGVKTLKPRPIDPCDLARQIEALTITSKERYISSTPERILDAPDLIDDFYLNLIDWGKPTNMIAVALMNCVFLWDDQSGNVTKLLELQTSNSTNDEYDDDEQVHYVSSVAWHGKSPYLAVGTSYQQVLIYDVNQQICKRKLIPENMLDDDDRIPCLAWNQNIIACGTRNSGDILLYDVRQKDCIIRFQSHRQEVCGLKWCPNGRYLASGSNDNTVCVWDFHQWYSTSGTAGSFSSLLPPADGGVIKSNTPTKPLWHFKDHKAAVKAVAWCPWEGSKVLATGGGHSDGYLRFWNNSNGTCQQAIKTDSQISSILWSTDYKQIVTGQGHPNNFIHIWHYPSMEKCHTLHGHTSRILSLIMGPKGNPVVSLSADETIRFWNCFPVDVQRKKKLEMTRTNSFPTKLNFNCR
ncbi:unnamed protein product [Adineta steineri]|uniref:CDC20/Fizzy WD40 domain-containing protein n=1 Tax=Adineta steineri TaxID=433720 RepID=A0A813VJ71_9BILA|nr:unnamed protein product [Adineta steineri]CAF3644179.1 unnamed protein product [Adineta steineri]